MSVLWTNPKQEQKKRISNIWFCSFRSYLLSEVCLTLAHTLILRNTISTSLTTGASNEHVLLIVPKVSSLSEMTFNLSRYVWSHFFTKQSIEHKHRLSIPTPFYHVYSVSKLSICHQSLYWLEPSIGSAFHTRRHVIVLPAVVQSPRPNICSAYHQTSIYNTISICRQVTYGWQNDLPTSNVYNLVLSTCFTSAVPCMTPACDRLS